MTRCASENLYPAQGLAWEPPETITCHLQTDRLIVRAYTLNDAPALFEAINESREDHLLPWMPWARDAHHTIESTTKYVCEQALAIANPASFNNVGTGIFCKQTGRFLGGSGIHDVRRDTASCETGYWIRKGETGKGYAQEACRRTISWALEDQSRAGMGLRRVRIYCSNLNAPSAKLIANLGIRREVHQRDDYYIDGLGLSDRLGWGVLKDEWDCANHKAVTNQPSA